MTVAVILAGGAGRRMGGNKPFHPFGGSTLIETVVRRFVPQVDTIAINTGHRLHPLVPTLSELGLSVIFDDDELADLGPLSGVLSALSFAALHGESHVFTAPCDMPYLPDDFIKRLKAVPPCDVAFISGTRDHPLCARWSVSVAPLLRDKLLSAKASGGLSVMKFIDGLRFERIPVEDEDAFANFNAPGEAG